MTTKNNIDQKTAFTLIELLSVIAIVGVLLSILVPVAGKTMTQMDRMKTISNLKTMGSASQLYATVHQWYPGASSSRMGRVRKPLTLQGVSYDTPADYTKLQPLVSAHLAEKLYGFTETDEVFDNPLAEGQLENGWSYVQNRTVFGYISAGKDPLRIYHQRAADASKIWAICDIDTIMPSPPSRGNMPMRAVNDERAYLFLDGHTEWVTIQEANWHPEEPAWN